MELEVIRIRCERKRKLLPFTSRNFNFYIRDKVGLRVLTSFFFFTQNDFFKLENGGWLYSRCMNVSRIVCLPSGLCVSV
jgi:hypothetical protein